MKKSLNKIINQIIPIIIMTIWLLPVSNEANRLNEGMVRNVYIVNLLFLVFVLVYENYLNTKRMIISFSIILILFISTVLFHNSYNTISVISYGYLLNYIPFCVLLCINPKKISKNKIIDKVFIFVCILIIIVGFLMSIGNTYIWDFLRKYYVNHYAYVYTSMILDNKTVTFFSIHSISCYLYFIMWMMLDYRASVIKGKISYLLMAGILYNIAMCKSGSAVLCLTIIFIYYYTKWLKNATKKNVLRSLIVIIVAIAFMIANFDKIILIITSPKNGLLGRFGDTGNLMDTIQFRINSGLPIGICDADGFWATDGGYFIHFLRGGIVMILLIYGGLYLLIRDNLLDKRRAKYLYISLLLFEVGYQFSICMRFLMIMLFALAYFRFLDNITKIGSAE